MDLRIVKTRRAIHDAFMQIRATTPLEKVRVRDICERALINKSTFYNHYDDVFALSDELEDELVDQCIEGFEYKDRLFSDPALFFQNVPTAIEARRDEMEVLFAGRMQVLYQKLQRRMRRLYTAEATTPEQDVLLTFVIGGAMYAMQELGDEGRYDAEQISDATARTVRTLAKANGL